MADRSDLRSLVDRIECLIHVDVGRNISALFDAARGGLWGAASALVNARSGGVGLITGFYVPQGTPPAAETDGPVGAGLQEGLRRSGSHAGSRQTSRASAHAPPHSPESELPASRSIRSP
jgi:hypothetical protein